VPERQAAGTGFAFQLRLLRLRASLTQEALAEKAAALALSVATVERDLANLYERIGARGRADATLYAVRVGLVSPGRPGS